MEDLEKQIEKAAEKYIFQNTKLEGSEDHFINFSGGSFEKDCWINGAKSLEAKQYWQQGMYSEEEVFNLAWQLWEGFLHETKEYPDYHTWFEENKKK